MNRVLISVLFPIISLLIWLGTIERNISQGQLVRIRAEGYDPRDLLAGHYINFTLNPGAVDPCKEVTEYNNPDNERCVCLAPDDGGIYHTTYWGGRCEERPSNCSTYLIGSCRWHRFTAGIERYSIPERFAPVLQRVPEHSSVIISINSGQAKVVQFLVEESTLEEYAEGKLREMEIKALESSNIKN